MRYVFVFILSLGLNACSTREMDESDERVLADLIQAKQEVVDSCYQKVISGEKQKLEGRISIRADRSPDGRLVAPRLIDGFPGSQKLYTCLASEIRTWVLNPYYNRGSVEFTWDFSTR